MLLSMQVHFSVNGILYTIGLDKGYVNFIAHIPHCSSFEHVKESRIDVYTLPNAEKLSPAEPLVTFSSGKISNY